MLWVLHLCADAGIIVILYSDAAVGTMIENEDGSGQFTSVTLYPQMTITDAGRVLEAAQLHARAHEMCFVARSVNFPVQHVPTVDVA
jgi:organic hydroperoxide reductase OsmC/OhrA